MASNACVGALGIALFGLLALPALAGCVAPPDNAWAVRAVQLDAVPNLGNSRAIRIAILDSGLDFGHPVLRHLADDDPFNGQATYLDFLDAIDHPVDRDGHGTFITGVLAARPATGLASLRPGAADDMQGLLEHPDLLVGRVCGRESCSLHALWRGLQWAVAEDADLIVLSLGFRQEDILGQQTALEGIRQSLDDAEKRGILVVAAAGNDGWDHPVLFPANAPTVLAVGAMDQDGQPRPTSSRGAGDKPDLVAPGQGIVGPAPGNGLVRMDGTSAAVPFVAAAAVLLMDQAGNPHTPEGVQTLRDALRSTAQPLQGQRVPHDPQAGYGALQAADALRAYAKEPVLARR